MVARNRKVQVQYRLEKSFYLQVRQYLLIPNIRTP